MYIYFCLCRRSKQSCASYVSSYYTMEALREMYACDVNPIPHTDDWFILMEIKNQIVGVPNNPKQAGRPKTSRIRSGGESSSRKKRKRSEGESSSRMKRTSGGEFSGIAPSSSSSRARICRGAMKLVIIDQLVKHVLMLLSLKNLKNLLPHVVQSVAAFVISKITQKGSASFIEMMKFENCVVE